MKTFNHVFFEPVSLKRVDEDGKRHYLHEETKKKYNSVTTVLSSLNKDGIKEWRKRVGEEEANSITIKASRRGTALHKICEDYIMNVVDFKKSHMPTTISMFLDLKPTIDNYISDIFGIEHQMYSDTLMAAGTCDLICNFDNKLTVLDYKTSSKEKKEEYITNYFLQATAYSIMIKELYKKEVQNIAILIAVENSTPQLFIKNPKDYYDQTIEIFKNYSQ